jgi:hypothetical protein
LAAAALSQATTELATVKVMAMLGPLALTEGRHDPPRPKRQKAGWMRRLISAMQRTLQHRRTSSVLARMHLRFLQ